MSDKDVIRCFFAFYFIPNQHNTQEMCDRVVSKDPFLIVYCPDKYKMCNEAVDDSLAALKLIPDWCVTNKLIKKLYTALYADGNILYFYEENIFYF